MTWPPEFTYVPAGRGGWPGWMRFKLKECWIVIRLLLARWPARAQAIALHNSSKGVHFTTAFLDRKAACVEPRLERASLVCPVSGVVSVLALAGALLLALLPIRGICWFVAMALRPRDMAVIYCDAQLSGFAFAIAYQRKGTPTATLHHGLYRHDDPVSMVGIANFVSDRAYLWNEVTREAFLAGGVEDARLSVVGQYGWEQDGTGEAPPDPGRVHLCPPFDEAQLPLYQRISAVLQPDWRTGFSLHPLLRGRHAGMQPQAVGDLDPAPVAAICGDSGAIMDCLSRGVPVVTIGRRVLAKTHLTRETATAMSAHDWVEAFRRAAQCLASDRARFGFCDTGMIPPDRSKEAGPAGKEMVERDG